MAKQESHPERANYDANDRVVFCTDPAGRGISVRPRQFLAAASPARLQEALAEIGDELGYEKGVQVEPTDQNLRGSWRLWTLPEGMNVVRVVRGLKERGIPAQPNHVYFVDSQPTGGVSEFNPNLFAPNLFAPNLFAPNLFAPNLFAPNLFAPNLFAPNLFAPNLFAGAAGCCCPRGLADDEERRVPPHLATPSAEPASIINPAKHAGVDLHVIDVAFVKGDANSYDANSDDWLDPVTGHGMFVASIVEQESGISTQLHGAADSLGTIDDVELVVSLRAVAGAARSETIRILNMSLSGYTYDDVPTQILADEIKDMIDDEWIIVASAGNNASCRLAWPAALPNVVAVGAYGHCGPAWFSSYGPWVDVSAPGVDVLSKFPSVDVGLPDDLIVSADENGVPISKSGIHDSGWATWSGTSFAAPLVAARLATAAAATNDAKAALAQVLEDPTLDLIPNYGVLIS